MEQLEKSIIIKLEKIERELDVIKDIVYVLDNFKEFEKKFEGENNAIKKDLQSI